MFRLLYKSLNTSVYMFIFNMLQTILKTLRECLRIHEACHCVCVGGGGERENEREIIYSSHSPCLSWNNEQYGIVVVVVVVFHKLLSVKKSYVRY